MSERRVKRTYTNEFKNELIDNVISTFGIQRSLPK